MPMFKEKMKQKGNEGERENVWGRVTGIGGHMESQKRKTSQERVVHDAIYTTRTKRATLHKSPLILSWVAGYRTFPGGWRWKEARRIGQGGQGGKEVQADEGYGLTTLSVKSGTKAMVKKRRQWGQGEVGQDWGDVLFWENMRKKLENARGEARTC